MSDFWTYTPVKGLKMACNDRCPLCGHWNTNIRDSAETVVTCKACKGDFRVM